MSETLYLKNRTDFQAILKESPTRAFRVFGLTMLYSLSATEVAREKYRMGISPRTPYDLYNLGVLSNQEGRHEEAIKLYEMARNNGGDFSELYYNIALSYEALKQKNKAVEAYTLYVDSFRKNDSEETRTEIRRIKNHIKELKG